MVERCFGRVWKSLTHTHLHPGPRLSPLETFSSSYHAHKKNLLSKVEKTWKKKRKKEGRQRTDALILASNVSKTENVTRICSGATAVEKWLVLADLIDAVVNIASISRTLFLHQRYGNIRTTLKVKASRINYNFSLATTFGDNNQQSNSSESLKNENFPCNENDIRSSPH